MNLQLTPEQHMALTAILRTCVTQQVLLTLGLRDKLDEMMQPYQRALHLKDMPREMMPRLDLSQMQGRPLHSSVGKLSLLDDKTPAFYGLENGLPLTAEEQRYLSYAKDRLDNDDCQVLEPNEVSVDEDNHLGAWVDTRQWISAETVDADHKHHQPRWKVEAFGQEHVPEAARVFCMVAADDLRAELTALGVPFGHIAHKLYTNLQTPENEETCMDDFFRLPGDAEELRAWLEEHRE